MPNAPDTDIIIFGGGIAGLWLLNRLRQKNIHAILIEKDSLGGVQTLASQGMIHGGQKYTLTGKASKHAVNIAEMPGVWAKCFAGEGEIDLSQVDMLSTEQIMWATPDIASSLGVFAAAKAVNANTEHLTPETVPEALRAHSPFKGKAYKLDEAVLDIKALITALKAKVADHIYQAEWTDFSQNADGSVTVSFKDHDPLIAQKIIFTAGKGNEAALEKLGIEKKMSQRRPLKQVMVKGVDYPLYGHCIVANPKPRATVTAHPHEGKYVWYFGGGIAETSVERSDEEACAFAKAEMQAVFPDYDWDNKEWATWAGDRAEPFSEDGHLPPGPHFYEFENIWVSWPTKLTFSPAMAEKICQRLDDLGFTTKAENTTLDMPAAEIGQYPWETASWVKV